MAFYASANRLGNLIQLHSFHSISLKLFFDDLSFSAKHSSPSTSRRETDQNTSEKKTSDSRRLEEGVVVTLSSTQNYGFIRPDNKSYGKDIIFHRTKLVNTRQLPSVGDRVQFYVTKRREGYGANEIRVQV